MKRLLTVLMGFILLLGVSGTGTAEEVRYPMYEINFAIGVSGNTTQPSDISASGGSVFYLNGTSDSVLDMSLYKT
ncbi:MAG: hypothetical protein KKC77_19165, partial [Proteobacteria bacterium]|nr:hypothetical protein [Pseudomonadota bacterium]